MPECIDYSQSKIVDKIPRKGARTLLDKLMYPVPAPWIAMAVTVIAVGMSMFHLYTGGMGVFTALIQRSVHLSLVMVLVFLTASARRKVGCEKRRVARL